MQETQVRSLCQEVPLEKEMATTPVLLPGKSHGQRNLVGYPYMGSQESDTTWWLSNNNNIPSIPTLLRAFIISERWILSNAFSASIEIILWFLYFILLMWYIKLIDLLILNHPCIPGIKSIWSWCIILFMYWSIQFVNILARIFFSSMFFGDIGL